MSRVYANLRVFIVLFAVAFLGACNAGGYGGFGGTPTAANTGIVTNNPESLPDITWQTNNQRQELAQQNNAIAREQKQEEAAAPHRAINVALLLPLSGRNAALGQSMLKAAQMALFDIGSVNFELQPRDTQGTPAGAAKAAQDAVAAHADLILGPVFADDLKAVKPIAAAANIPVVSFSTDWTLADSDTYLMGFLPFPQVARVAKYAASQGAGRIAVYAPQTDYCDVVIRTLKDNASVNHVSRYAAQQTDLPKLVQDFAQTTKDANGKLDFDALMLPLGGESLRSLTAMLDDSGIKQPDVRFIGTGLWDDGTALSNPSLVGGWFAAPDPRTRADFERRFRANYGSAPLRLASLSYDATALAAVLARTGGDNPYTHSALTNSRGFAGIDGIFRFRGDGLSERGLAVLEIKPGHTEVVDPAPTAFAGAS